MALVLLLLHAFGLVANVCLYYRVYKSWNSSLSRNVNKIVSFHLLLNICNIISHAGMEVSQRKLWISLSTNFSFQSIYFLAAIEFAVMLGRSVQQQLNSFFFIIALTVFSSGMAALYGERRYEICGMENCFNLTNLSVKGGDDTAILPLYFFHFLFPTSATLFASMFIGYRKWERIKAVDPTRSLGKRIVSVCASCAVALFLVYGSAFAEFVLLTSRSEGESRSGHLCRITCLYSELYFLLSVFPVGYLVRIGKKNDGALTQAGQGMAM